jgi:hypothetical protein
MHGRSLARVAVTAFFVALAAPLSPLVAGAQPAPSSGELARASVTAGIARREAHDHAGALRSFEAAYALDAAPTTGLEIAREQEALGLLVEARDTAVRVAGGAQGGAENDKARAEATALAEKIAPRIPLFQITIKGAADGVPLQVQIDGNRVPPGNLTSPRAVNPGLRAITIQAPGYAGIQRIVTVAEATTAKVEVLLFPEQAAPDGKRPAIPAAILAMAGKGVALTTKDGTTVTGKLLSVDEAGFVIERGDQVTVLLARTGARGVRLTDEAAAATPASPPAARPDPGLYVVHLQSNNPDVGLYRKGSVLGNELVCSAPCGMSVNRSAGDDFYLAIKKSVLGAHFSLPTSPEALTLKVEVQSPPSRGRRIAGAVLLPLGLGEIGIGAIYAAVDWNKLIAGGGVNDLYHGIGYGLMVVGGVMSITGIALLATAGGSYDVTLPSTVQSAPLMAAPRLRGLAFTPPLPSPAGFSPVSALATWEF